MCSALLCGEALAYMVLGKGPQSFFPRSFLLTKERFERAVAVRTEEGEDYRSCKL
jgi:hypothetical protein